ncbi:MAG: zinc-binding alcohol dehydrogenase family protein [Cyclobacteriaceae bacterium]|nr:zinc-binding alcohol dehydrogenase family protein [Cyclobacteriaceae bacterium]
MKILRCVSPGKLEYDTMPRPDLSEGNTILKIRRIGICGTDLHAFEGTQPYFSYPRILGHELAAEIVEMDGAAGFETGELVTVVPYFSCGKCIACREGKSNCCSRIEVCGVHRDGGMVEYLSVPSGSLLHGEGLQPDSLAMVEPLAIGAHGVRRASIQPGEYVLVVGAGPIGLGTMEFARIAGARVIAMDINEVRLRFCREKIGVTYTINSRTDDVEGRLREITNGDMPTVVFDATGSLKAIMAGFHFLAHGGRYVLIGLQKEVIGFSHPEFHKREATLMSSRNATREDFVHVMHSMRCGLVSPEHYITHRTDFDEVKAQFLSWLDPSSRVIKAMVSMD